MDSLVSSTPLFTMFLIFISAAFTDNILLARFLGMCSILGVSNRMDTSFGLGAAVVFVTAVTSMINYIVFNYILVPLGLEYLKLITFIIIIAATVQLIEMVIERVSETLYYSLGIFLPLITVNCAILGVSLFMLTNPYTYIETAIYGTGGGVGWLIAIMIIERIREKMDESKLPPGLAGPAITLIIIGIIALAFTGFSGMIKI